MNGKKGISNSPRLLIQYICATWVGQKVKIVRLNQGELLQIEGRAKGKAVQEVALLAESMRRVE